MDGAAVDIVADVKYVLRRLKQSLGFTATVVVMLALGIGATTAVFALIQQVMRDRWQSSRSRRDALSRVQKT
jgi:hypothetical protein